MPNHPTAPVFEECVGPIPTNCAKLKAKYGIRTEKYKKGSQNQRKEKHHIIQDKAMTGLISKYSGWCVFLNGGAGGEHDRANANQVKRNCPGGGVEKAGPKTFGGQLKAAKEDMEKALEGKKVDGNTVSKKEAQDLASCLVAEAEEETNKARARKKPKRPPLTKDSTVRGVKGCFPFGTLVWLTDVDLVQVNDLIEGVLIATTTNQQTVARVDKCFGSLVDITFGGNSVCLAPHHRIRLGNQAFVRADAVRPGHVVDTASGPAVVDGVTYLPAAQPLYSFSVSRRDACRVGPSGLWVEVRQSDIAVAGHASVLRTAQQ